MEIPFYKYQGTGNDFVIIDNRNHIASQLTEAQIEKCCNRKFGIGADGLMLLQEKEGFDFEMVYYNANGRLGSMCGNGGRCISAFANFLGILPSTKAYFLAVDGPHEAIIKKDDYVQLKMVDVQTNNYNPNYIFLDTGSPHHIEFVSALDSFDVYKHGKAIRYNEDYKKEGTNVNFIEVIDSKKIKVGTYERGVEDETLSCGTGVTAAAIAHFKQQQSSPLSAQIQIQIQTKGGELEVHFQNQKERFFNIWLCGPATQVFKGLIKL